MNDSGRMLFFLIRQHEAKRGDDWRAADAWRRLHARPDAPPLLDEPERPGLVARIASGIPIIRRVVPRGA